MDRCRDAFVPRAFALASFAVLLLPACGPGEDQPDVLSAIAPVSPTGSVSGFVYDALTGAPLEGVKVLVRASRAAKQASTDADGTYVIEGVPASDAVAVHYRADGYFDAWDNVHIPSSAGNLAQDNGVGFSGPMGLLPEPDASAFAPDLLVRADGVAVAATVTARLEVGWLDDGVAHGSLFADVGQAGGRFTLGGLPDFQRLAAVAPNASLRVVAVPADPAYAPRVSTLTVQSALTAGTVLMDLPRPGDGQVDLVVVASNVRDLVDARTRFPTVLPPGTPVTVELSGPVDDGSFFATAVNHRGQALATTASVSGTSVTLDIAGVSEGDQVFVYFEALPEGAAEAEGAVRLLTASGFFLTGASAGLVITAYDDARKNNALRSAANRNTLLCPADAGGALWLELSEHVGARDDDGNPVPLGELLPIRVTSTSVPANHPLNPANGGVVARMDEQAVGTPASGFSRWVRVDWTAVGTDQPAEPTRSYQFKLVFNDASLGATGRDTVVRSPNGAPVESLQQAIVEFAVRPPTPDDENGCAP